MGQLCLCWPPGLGFSEAEFSFLAPLVLASTAWHAQSAHQLSPAPTLSEPGLLLGLLDTALCSERTSVRVWPGGQDRGQQAL